MLERPSERFLAALVAALLSLLLLDQVVVQPVERYAARLENSAADLELRLASLPSAEAGEPQRPAWLDRAERRLERSLTDRQNEFRRSLESELLQGLWVLEVQPAPPRPAPRDAALRVLSFQVRLRATHTQLHELLATLDATPEPLRVDYLRAGQASGEAMLLVDMTISTLARAEVQ